MISTSFYIYAVDRDGQWPFRPLIGLIRRLDKINRSQAFLADSDAIRLGVGLRAVQLDRLVVCVTSAQREPLAVIDMPCAGAGFVVDDFSHRNRLLRSDQLSGRC